MTIVEALGGVSGKQTITEALGGVSGKQTISELVKGGVGGIKYKKHFKKSEIKALEKEGIEYSSEGTTFIGAYIELDPSANFDLSDGDCLLTMIWDTVPNTEKKMASLAGASLMKSDTEYPFPSYFIMSGNIGISILDNKLILCTYSSFSDVSAAEAAIDECLNSQYGPFWADEFDLVIVSGLCSDS